MPGDGIADDERGLLPWSWAVEQLTAARRYWIAAVAPDGAPHSMSEFATSPTRWDF